MCLYPIKHKRFSFLIGPNDVLRNDITKLPAFCQSKHHFRWSNKQVVNASIIATAHSKRQMLEKIGLAKQTNTQEGFFEHQHTNYVMGGFGPSISV